MDDLNPSPGLFDKATATVEQLRQALPKDLHSPKVAIICGSGLGGLADSINEEPRVEIPYAKALSFPVSTVQGHAGNLVFGTIGPKPTPVVLLVGRAHFYEGHSMELVTYATRVCKIFGVETLIVTNAAGGLNPTYSVGDIVMLNDHLNIAGLVGINPLRGPNDDSFGVRFPPLSDAYDLELRRRAHAAWAKHGFSRTLHEGVYAFVAGPYYETRAECRMLRLLGADVVGMSTVPEIIVARHSRMRVVAFSLVTNMAVLEGSVRGDDEGIQGLSTEELGDFLSRGRADHGDVLAEGQRAARDMVGFVKGLVEDLY